MSSVLRSQDLNRECPCESHALDGHPRFYSNVPVFVAAEHVHQMQSVIDAVQAVAALPGYRAAVLAEAPPIARIDPGTPGVFTGFDFHVGADGPKLIEINTNAGGALLNAAAEWRHPACCSRTAAARLPESRAVLEARFVAMFRNEWRLARGDRPLRSIAIVDDEPQNQFLYAEFQLCAAMLADAGIRAFVADARELVMEGSSLTHQGRPIDLVYNRLTDFHFDQASHGALRVAYATRAAVITPHPHAHALLADKRNLAKFTDREFLGSVGAGAHDIAVLTSRIPCTRLVVDEAGWWRERKKWFFKPARGFGSRGAYRGDKLTQRVFGEVLRGGYIAQELTPPGERVRVGAHGPEPFKVDLRCYVYDGVLQLLAARLYQGQTTNFRTVGGGFAPVIELRDVVPAA